MTKSLAPQALLVRCKHVLGLDECRALNALQDFGLVSDECIHFSDIAPSDAARILDDWVFIARRLKQ